MAQGARSVIGAGRHRPRHVWIWRIFTTVFLLVALALWASISNGGPESDVGALPNTLERRSSIAGSHEVDDLGQPGHKECKLVYRAKDQCAFVKANCCDSEPSLISYLTFYYCRLQHARIVAFTILILWMCFLFMTIGIAASDFFCVNLNTIATVLGMSENVAGVTFLAFGNGSPDVFSTFAAMNSHSGSLAVGELIGAASFITAVVAGSMALVQPFKVDRSSFRRDVSFFMLAVAFSMFFLADGRLQLWECIVMICFYIAYVTFVVVWHWRVTHRKQRRKQHSSGPPMYRDVVEDDAEAGGRRSADNYRDVVEEDTSLVSQSRSPGEPSHVARLGPKPVIRLEDEDLEREEDNSLAVLQSSMRVSRKPIMRRLPTLNSIRPSLLGALEFRASYFSAGKRHASHSAPHASRRHSYDPSIIRGRPRHQLSSVSDSQLNLQHPPSVPHSPRSAPRALDRTVHRARAVSEGHLLAPHAVPPPPVHRGALYPESTDSAVHSQAQPFFFDQGVTSRSGNTSPSICLSPSPSVSVEGLDHSTASLSSANRLAPPPERFLRVSHHRQDQGMNERNQSEPPAGSNGRPRAEVHYDVGSRDSAPPSPFPRFTESPPATLAQEMPYLPHGDALPRDTAGSRRGLSSVLRVFPSPSVVLPALFPVLQGWSEKSAWERALDVIATPIVFFLTITLPVVDMVGDDGDEIESEGMPTLDDGGGDVGKGAVGAASAVGPPLMVVDGEPDQPQNGVPHILGAGAPSAHAILHTDASMNYGSLGRSADIVEQYHSQPRRSFDGAADGQHQQHHHLGPQSAEPAIVKVWNRWLVCVQIIVSPIFVMLIIWANTTPDPGNMWGLGRLLMFTVPASLIALAFFLTFTNAEKPPPYRSVLCFFGFIVSVAWISTIATEVVGVLKAFGVILRISDAILGLTVFAVGNSLGDLVANITVARLGHQVMALSACFGGPLLNILLGIGIGGLYKTIRHGTHKVKGAPQYRPYILEISTTLVISGATLLLTLVGLLILVPLNGGRLDRKLAWGLIGLWTISTICNVVVEVAGWGSDIP